MFSSNMRHLNLIRSNIATDPLLLAIIVIAFIVIPHIPGSSLTTKSPCRGPRSGINNPSRDFTKIRRVWAYSNRYVSIQRKYINCNNLNCISGGRNHIYFMPKK